MGKIRKRCFEDRDSWLKPKSEMSMGAAFLTSFPTKTVEEGALALRVADLEAQNEDRKSEILELNSRLAPIRTVPISSLGIEGLKIHRPINVTISNEGDEAIATWVEANISSSGDNWTEAINNLISLLADVWQEVVDTPDDQLGKTMLRQKNVFKEFLCRE